MKSCNPNDDYVLLILDGHNSHCSYTFCDLAERHKIVLLCLPSHTTHALQPCDSCVFSPLATAWKAWVTWASQCLIPINKYTLLEHYSAAREKAMKEKTIHSAFRTTGMHPFNRHALPASAFEPSKHTTTQFSQPLPARLPVGLIPINPPDPPPPTAQAVGTADVANVRPQRYQL